MTLQSHLGQISTEKQDPKGYIHSYAHCSIVYNSQDLEATRMPIDRGMDKDVAHIHSRVLLSH